MKIKYEFINGDVSEIEVNEEIGNVILDMKRKESNRNKMEQRHCYSYDAIEFEGDEYGKEDTYVIEKNNRVGDAFEKLSEVQKRRLKMLADGLSMREIARIESVHHSVISESINMARKKFLKKF